MALAWVCCALNAGCASNPPAVAQTYVVQPHDTLYAIAWRHDVDYRDLARWNNLGADFTISVGQVLILAPPKRPSAAEAPAAARAARSGKPGAVEDNAAGAAAKWDWPTDRTSDPRPVPGGGILLPGRLGQDVRAARPGRVVYAGNGLRAYGNLLIIKHGENLLSAYAHNSDLVVREGQEVARGQVVAHMGLGPHRVCALYFEIRLDGRPVDPLKYLGPVH
jgi:lipoprotein NlpD